MDKTLAIAALLAAPLAHAGSTPLQQTLREAVERASASVPARIEIEFPPWQAPPAIAACARAEPFVPAGAKVWGRSYVGVRCVDAGNGASALVPVVVRAHVDGLVAARTLPAGTTLSPADFHAGEVDAAAQPGTLAADPSQVVGRTLARAVLRGAGLRLEAFRPRLAVAAGDAVRIVYSGPGFTVSADGRALSAAQDGQPVRVQTDAGRLMTGTARPGRVVEMRPAEFSAGR